MARPLRIEFPLTPIVPLEELHVPYALAAGFAYRGLRRKALFGGGE
jgi:hypothetical protein